MKKITLVLLTILFCLKSEAQNHLRTPFLFEGDNSVIFTGLFLEGVGGGMTFPYPKDEERTAVIDLQSSTQQELGAKFLPADWDTKTEAEGIQLYRNGEHLIEVSPRSGRDWAKVREIKRERLYSAFAQVTIFSVQNQRRSCYKSSPLLRFSVGGEVGVQFGRTYLTYRNLSSNTKHNVLLERSVELLATPKASFSVNEMFTISAGMKNLRYPELSIGMGRRVRVELTGVFGKQTGSQKPDGALELSVFLHLSEWSDKW